MICQNVIILLSVCLLSVLCVMYKGETFKITEGFTDKTCPNVLIQKGKHLYLINNKVAKVPGINPIKFNNLDEYVEYLKWQRYQGIRCPVLYLQNSYDIQGNQVYINRQSPIEKNGGTPIISGLDLFNNNNRSLLVDATRNHPPYNQNLYPGFDEQDQNIGLNTPLDKMFHAEAGSVSPNSMDPNWGGSEYTKQRIEAGDYKDNNVNIYIP